MVRARIGEGVTGGKISEAVVAVVVRVLDATVVLVGVLVIAVPIPIAVMILG